MFCKFVALVGLLLAGCERKKVPPVRPGKPPAIASLVPAATDLILAMGAADHLIAVSNYDHDPQAAKLPRVGDYQSQDWEKLSQLRPDVIITQYGPDRTPGGFLDRIRTLGARQVNVKFDRLADVYSTLEALGSACSEPAAAKAEADRIRTRIDLVHRRVEGKPAVRAIVVTGPSGWDMAGRDTYLDDLLIQAGGENATNAVGYVTLDREALAALKPEVILQLLPDADAGTQLQARKFWDLFPNIPAVREHRIWQYTENLIMQPGSRVADVVEKFAAALHPVRPTSQP